MKLMGECCCCCPAANGGAALGGGECEKTRHIQRVGDFSHVFSLCVPPTPKTHSRCLVLNWIWYLLDSHQPASQLHHGALMIMMMTMTRRLCTGCVLSLLLLPFLRNYSTVLLLCPYSRLPTRCTSQLCGIERNLPGKIVRRIICSFRVEQSRRWGRITSESN